MTWHGVNAKAKARVALLAARSVPVSVVAFYQHEKGDNSGVGILSDENYAGNSSAGIYGGGIMAAIRRGVSASHGVINLQHGGIEGKASSSILAAK